jgi:nicotinamide-nucleotide amidase
MQAILLSIGDELVLGQTVDTNSAWLSQELAAVGCGVTEHVTVPDDQPAIENAIRAAIQSCDLLLISGGIGPTADDLTRQALADVMGVQLELNERWLANLVEFFKSRGRDMPEINKIQAMIPRGAKMIENSAGTAAGIYVILNSGSFYDLDALGRAKEKVRRLQLEQEVQAESKQTPPAQRVSDEYMERMFGDRAKEPQTPRKRQWSPGNPTHVFVMPGVPKEMKAMFLRDVLPQIKQEAGGAVILSRTLHTFGLGESTVAEKLGDLMRRDRNPSVGTTVSNGIVSLRINARFPSLPEAQQQLEATAKECQQALGDLIFGQDEQSLPEIVSAMLFYRAGTTVSTAESCTGGLLAKMLTDIPGSSAYFKRGWITYANEAKIELLGVPPEILAEHGAVSEQVVRAMAAGAQQRANSTYAIAISGIAGPDGGTATKPVGTVCIALAHEQGCDTRTFILTGDREMIRDRSAKMALTMLRFHLLEKPLPF